MTNVISLESYQGAAYLTLTADHAFVDLDDLAGHLRRASGDARRASPVNSSFSFGFCLFMGLASDLNPHASKNVRNIQDVIHLFFAALHQLLFMKSLLQ